MRYPKRQTFGLLQKIAFLKKEMGILVEDRDRERIIFLKLDDDARRNNLDENFVSDIFEKIISHSKFLQTNIMEGQK